MSIKQTTRREGAPDPRPEEFSPMPDIKKRAERRKQQAAEVEASQVSLRQSIAETERLVSESDKMLRRHRRECEEDDKSDGSV
jgi:hypothetical protein